MKMSDDKNTRAFGHSLDAAITFWGLFIALLIHHVLASTHMYIYLSLLTYLFSFRDGAIQTENTVGKVTSLDASQNLYHRMDLYS